MIGVVHLEDEIQESPKVNFVGSLFCSEAILIPSATES
ncbi:hypothetical protein A2U01_0099297, partial [Trifolium medium]|nr:hypothetical protein [Trifolium medium]